MCDTFDWKRPDDAFPAYPSLNCGAIIHVLYSDPRFHVGKCALAVAGHQVSLRDTPEFGPEYSRQLNWRAIVSGP